MNANTKINTAGAIDIETILADIRAAHRERVFMMDSRKRSDLALGSYLRRHLGWRLDNPKDENNRIKDLTAELIECGEKVHAGKDHKLKGSKEFIDCSAVILASIQARDPISAVEDRCTKDMEAAAKQLPVWSSFGEGVKGFGARSLASILAETGDLLNYATPSRVWKRMGLGVLDGVRQGGLSKTAHKSEWIAHGYSRKRRSIMFVIGDVLVKNQSEYREIYLARKEIERQKAAERGLLVAPAAKIPEKQKDKYISDGHIHRRAQRYMEKRFLRDLWKAYYRSFGLNPPSSPNAWEKRQAIDRVSPLARLPAATSSAQAERSANSGLSTNHLVPSAIDAAKAVGGDHATNGDQTADVAPTSSTVKAKRRTAGSLKTRKAVSGQRGAASNAKSDNGLPRAKVSAKRKASN